MKKLFLLLIIVIDQILKFFYYSQNNFTLNTGFGLGFLGGTKSIIAILCMIFLIILLAIIYARSDKEQPQKFALLLVILGATSNLTDRILYGGVVDYINIGVLPRFNLADVVVVCGILTLLLFEIRKDVRKNPSFKN